MHKLSIILLSFSLVGNALSQNASVIENQALLDEIKSIENGLLENIQIKGETTQTYNILERMEHYNVPGVSIAIVENGELKWAKGYGMANTNTGAEVDVNTLFQAGSISKPLAALSALKLYENGQIKLDQNVNDYLKGWQLPENEFTTSENVTIERLLTHTAGTTVHGFPGYKQTDSFPTIIEVLSGEGNTSNVTVDTEPGSGWRYSGGGYTIMEKAVEDVSGEPLETYMAEHILTPMGMKNSTYLQPVTEDWQRNISAAYNGRGQMTEGKWNNYPEQAAAGLWTTPSDLALYCMEIQQILNGKEGILKKKTVDLMLKKNKGGWGLGPSLRYDKESLIFEHGGKNEGFTNNLVAFAHTGHAVIIMTNADNGGNLIREIENAVAQYYDWPVGKRKVIELVELSDKELRKYEGNYKMKGQGLVVTWKLENNILMANTPFGLLQLKPMSNDNFIDLGSSTMFKFEVDEKVTGFKVSNGMEFERIEE